MYLDYLKDKPITSKQIQKDEKLHSDICLLIQTGYYNSQQASSQKRAFHQGIDEAVKQLHADNRIQYDILFSQKKAFIAMFQNEGLYPVFSSDRKNREITEVQNKVAQYDSVLMNKQQKDTKMLGDVFDYGVGLRVYNGYDFQKATPTFLCPSPLSRYYDPNGNNYDNNYDYHMFVLATSKADLKQTNMSDQGFRGLDDVAEGMNTLDNFIQQGKEQRLQQDALSPGGVVYVMNVFVCINGIKYFGVVANGMTKIIKREQIIQEKKKGVVEFPVAITNVFPDAYDPRGISYREKIYPIQNAITAISNAIHEKQMRQAGHSVMLFDPLKVSNVNDLLERPSGGPLRISSDLSQGGDAVRPVFEDNQTQQNENYIQTLNKYAEDMTSITGVVKGLTPDAGTLGETEIQLQKSNAMFGVDAENLVAGEIMFWNNIYYPFMKFYLGKIKQKIFTQGGTDGTIIIIDRRDLIGGHDPYISVKSKRRMAEENQKVLAGMNAILPILIQDQNVPPISVKIFKRELMKRYGLDESFIYGVEEIDRSERHAIQMQNQINDEIEPENFIAPGVDLQTLWIYINQCLDNPIKRMMLNQLNFIMMQEGISEPKVLGGDMQGLTNSMASQNVSNANQQLAKPVL